MNKKRQQTKTQKAGKKQKTQEQNQKIKSDTGFQLVPKNTIIHVMLYNSYA